MFGVGIAIVVGVFEIVIVVAALIIVLRAAFNAVGMGVATVVEAVVEFVIIVAGMIVTVDIEYVMLVLVDGALGELRISYSLSYLLCGEL